MLDTPEAQRGSQVELDKLLAQARNDQPGVFELLEVYGGYEEAMTAVSAYLEPTRPQPFITTSNQSQPTLEV